MNKSLCFALIIIALVIAGCGQSSSTSGGDGSGDSGTKTFTLTSAFSNNGSIPHKYAHAGHAEAQNISVPLSWSNAPSTTKSFVLSMIDTAANANNFVHWIVINIPSTTSSLSEGASKTSAMPTGSTELTNAFEETGYGGPHPPSGDPAHSYVFTIYALNASSVDLMGQVSKSQLDAALSGKVLEQAALTGKFSL